MPDRRVGERLARLAPEQRRRLLQELAARRAAGPRPAVPRRPADGPAPLSFAQRRLWLIDRVAPGSAAYNVPVAVRLDGELAMFSFRGDRDAEAELLRSIVHAGFPVVEFGAQHKSLEDVFLHVTEGRVQ